MEPNEIHTALTSAVEEVLETMCFATVLSSSVVPPEGGSDAPAITAVLRFHGSPSGGFRVSVPLKLARVVGASFLGREEGEVSDSQAEEVVCEMANMICGAVLSHLESEATFRISHPELTPSESGVGLEGTGTCRWFDLGDGLLAASLQLEQGV